MFMKTILSFSLLFGVIFLATGCDDDTCKSNKATTECCANECRYAQERCVNNSGMGKEYCRDSYSDCMDNLDGCLDFWNK